MTQLVVQSDAMNTLDSTMWFTYQSPAQNKLQLLPPRCTLPYLYKQTTQFSDVRQSPVLPGMLQTTNVPSYTFSTVANTLLFSVRPLPATGTQFRPFNECDFLATFPDSPFQQFQYSNMSGLMSNMTRQKAIAIGRHNGVVASVSQYGGAVGLQSQGTVGAMMSGGFPVGMGGTVIALTPGIDFQLPEGTAGGTSGNIQIQYAIQYINQGRRPAFFQITTTNISTGFFVIDNGAARIMLAGLDEEAVTSAPMGADSWSAAHLVGGGTTWYNRLANLFGRVYKHRDHFRKIYDAGKDAYHAWTSDDAGQQASGAGMSMNGGAGAKRLRGSLSEMLSRC